MRVIPFETVAGEVERLVIQTVTVLPPDVCSALETAREGELPGPARSILDQIVENAQIASDDTIPLCQDTGVAVFFIDMGESVRVDGDGIAAAVQEGARRGYRNGLLRMSMVRDPLRRENTGDNSPAIMHWRPVAGDCLDIAFCPKGGGCENMSRLAMLRPGDGRAGIIDFILETVWLGGGRPCPPLVIGVGLGGDFECAAILAKHALFRSIGDINPDPFYREFEDELLDRINALRIGPMGIGGATTALDVFVETAPCHIASLPVAVNIQCHSARHGRISL